MEDKELRDAVQRLTRGVEALVSELRLARGAEEYGDQGRLEQWLAQRCTTEAHPGLGAPPKERSVDLHADFSQWCLSQEVAPPSVTAFGRRLSDLGYPRKKINGVFYRAGLRLLFSRTV